MNALLLIDIQNDFLPGGSLAVARGDEVIDVANRLMASKKFDAIYATQDWHPANHGSFASQHAGKKPFEQIELAGLDQTLWPDHCVQFTGGALFAPQLETQAIQRVFVKGTDRTIDSYSGFFDNGRRAATGLGAFLKEAGVREISIVGLATDYCVKFTALDARSLGFKTRVILPGCRGVNLHPDDTENAAREMHRAGVEVIDALPPG